MDFKLLTAGTSGLAGMATDALVVLVTGDTTPATLDAPLAALLNQARKDGEFAAKAGQTFFVLRPAAIKAARVVFVHAGDGSVKALRKAVAAAVNCVKAQARVTVALAAGEGWTAASVEALVTACADATYVYRTSKPSAPAAAKLAQISLVVNKAEQADVKLGVARAEAIVEGMAVAREAANRPGNYCTPTYLAQVAKDLGKAHGLKVQVLEKKDCEKLGMGSFLAVAQGSEEPPKFIVMQYQGGAKTAAPVVLVGKGITFDTGGISLKPAPEMDEMKFDMGGAASVLGAMKAIAVAKPKVNVVGIIAACENMPSGRAVKPGDVVTSMSGQTIEILNTDAEGRLILCDALTYAERFKPAALVDIATLTGACVIALGNHRSGLFSNDDALAADLLAAGEASGDLAWRMPLDEEYEEGLKTNFADVANVAGRAGGSITAAKFLQRFTAKQKWAHLDIAGTGWKSGAAKGSTGRPVPLLVHFVLARAKG